MSLTTRLAASALLAASATAIATNASAEPTKQECVQANDAQQTLRGQNKLRGARDAARLCASQSCGRMAADCAQAIYEIERLIPTIVFEVKDAEGRDVAAVKVSMDGQKLADRLDGSALEVDLGDHEFAFEANGQVAKQHFLIREGDKARRERVTVGEAKTPATTSTAPPPIATVTPDTKPAGGTDTAPIPTPPDSASTGTGQRVAGGVVAGLGVVGVAVGTVFLLMGNSANNDYGASLCPTGQGTTCQAAADKKSEINSDWLIGGISLGVGGAALITGAIVFFTAPSGKNATASWLLVPSVGPGSAGLLFTSAF